MSVWQYRNMDKCVPKRGRVVLGKHVRALPVEAGLPNCIGNPPQGALENAKAQGALSPASIPSIHCRKNPKGAKQNGNVVLCRPCRAGEFCWATFNPVAERRPFWKSFVPVLRWYPRDVLENERELGVTTASRELKRQDRTVQELNHFLRRNTNKPAATKPASAIVDGSGVGVNSVGVRLVMDDGNV